MKWSEELWMVDIEASQWRRFLKLFAGRQGPPPVPRRLSGVLLCLYDGPRVLKFFHTERGRLDPPASFTGLSQLKAWRRRLRARQAFALHLSAFQKIATRWQRDVSIEMDYGWQWFLLFQAVQAEYGKSWFSDPPLPRSFKLLSPFWLDRLVTRFVPPDGTAIFALFEGTRPYASCAVGWRRHTVDLITTLDHIRDGFELEGWPGGVDEIRTFFGRRYARPYIALFARRRGWEALQAGRLSLREAEAKGHLVLDPCPRLARVALQARFRGGGEGVRGGGVSVRRKGAKPPEPQTRAPLVS